MHLSTPSKDMTLYPFKRLYFHIQLFSKLFIKKKENAVAFSIHSPPLFMIFQSECLNCCAGLMKVKLEYIRWIYCPKIVISALCDFYISQTYAVLHISPLVSSFADSLVFH